MKGLGVLLSGVDPGLQRFQDEKVVAFDEARVLHPALEIAEAFLDQRRPNVVGGQGRQCKALELVGAAAGAVAAARS